MTETVYIVDDDAVFARGLARLLNAAGWGTQWFASASEFLDSGAVPATAAGCIVLDVRMPGMKGPEMQRAMVERRIDLPVIFLTGHGDVPTSVDAMKLGAVDFLEKPVSRDVLVRAVRLAMERHAVQRLHTSGRRAVETRMALLSTREREVMEHVVAGQLNKQIASDLGISLKTVKAHRAKVMQKMDAPSLAALVDMCRDAGLPAPTRRRPDSQPA